MTMRVRMVLMLIVGLAAISLTSCDHYTCSATFGVTSCSPGTPSLGGGGTGSGATAFVYVAGGEDSLALAGLNVADSGTFGPVATFEPPTLPSGQGQVGMVVVSELYLYILISNDTLYGFSIDSTTGAVTAVPNSPYTVTSVSEAAAYTLVADPTGRFLFVSDSTGIESFTIAAADGSLTLNSGSPVSNSGFFAGQLATDGLGKYLYGVTTSPGSGVLAYSYSAAGLLTPVPNSPFLTTLAVNFNMAEIQGEPTGQFILGVSDEVGEFGGPTDNHVYVFGIAQTGSTSGALTPVTGSPFPTTNSPQYMTVSPNGTFVYTFEEDFNNQDAGTIYPMEGFTLGSSGSLTPLGVSFAGLDATIGRFDQSGAYLFTIAIDPTTGVGGYFPYAASTTTGALTSTLSSVPAPGAVYAVTDAP
jgi:6-phosphogluconolactonase